MVTREQKLKAVWKGTHRDFKGIMYGERYVLVLREGGTCSVPLEMLTDDEIEARTPKKKDS